MRSQLDQSNLYSNFVAKRIRKTQMRNSVTEQSFKLAKLTRANDVNREMMNFICSILETHQYKSITYDNETKFPRTKPVERDSSSPISMRNTTLDRPMVIGLHVNANFARQWQVFLASTTGSVRENPYTRENGPTHSPDFHARDAAATTENSVRCVR